MDYFKSILESLHFLLSATGVDYWVDWLTTDLALWESEKSVERHLSAFDAEEGINILVISMQNGHQITDEQEPWANGLLSELRGFSFTFANAFSTGRVIDISDPELITPIRIQIFGEYCPVCGFLSLTRRNIDDCIARNIVSQEIVDGLRNDRLKTSVTNCLSMNLPVIATRRTRLRELARQSGIYYTENSGLPRSCPNCGSNEATRCREIDLHW